MTFTQIFIRLVPEKYHFSRHFPRLCRRNERWNKLILYIAIKTSHRDSLQRCNYTCDYFQPISKKGSFTGTLLSKNFSVYYAGGNWAAPALNCGCFCAFEVSYQTQRRRKMFHIVFRRTSCILRFAITLEFLNHLAGCAELKSILIYFHHLTR